jgi:hypothetical protein
VINVAMGFKRMSDIVTHGPLTTPGKMNIFYDDLVKHPFFQTFWSNDDIIV